MNGSDSERMITEIEAFLRTGEAPPPAPEPAAPLRPRSRSEVRLGFKPGPEPLSRWERARMAVFGAALSRRTPSDRAQSGRALSRRTLSGRLGRIRLRSRTISPAGRSDLRSAGPSAGRHGGGYGFEDPYGLRPVDGGAGANLARWTPWRVALILAVLLALIVVPLVVSNHVSGATPVTPDHASAAPAGPGYTFLKTNRSGTPVRWDPCSPVRYETDLAGAPSYAAADIGAAIRAVSEATGIRFVDAGSTTAFPAKGPALRRGPVVIAWATPAETAELQPLPPGAAPSPFGRAEPVALLDGRSGQGVYVTGSVVIAASADQLPRGFGPGGVGAVILHQLGQLMGLGPVTDPGEVMNAGTDPGQSGAFGTGDLAGLQRLGAGSGCLALPSHGSLQVVL